MTARLDEIDKEVLKRALADSKSEERKRVGAAMIAKHKAAIVDMLRDAASEAEASPDAVTKRRAK